MAFITPPPAEQSSAPTDSLQALRDNMSGSLAVPLILLAFAALVIVLGYMRTERRSGKRHRPQTQQTGFHRQPARSSPQVPAGSPDHMTLVAGANFHVVPLLNKSEARLLPMLERIMREIGQGHRVMAQVSMGEVLRAEAGFDSEANRAINAKRLDFIVIDRRGMTVAALEYQGSGHHLSDTAFMRDAVKREALRKAGISLIELPPDTDDTLLRNRLAEQTNLPVRLPAPSSVTP